MNSYQFLTLQGNMEYSSKLCLKLSSRDLPAGNWRRHTLFNLNSTGPPLTWSPSHMKKGEPRIFLLKPHTGSRGFEPWTQGWLARQWGDLPMRHVPLSGSQYYRWLLNNTYEPCRGCTVTWKWLYHRVRIPPLWLHQVSGEAFTKSEGGIL